QCRINSLRARHIAQERIQRGIIRLTRGAGAIERIMIRVEPSLCNRTQLLRGSRAHALLRATGHRAEHNARRNGCQIAGIERRPTRSQPVTNRAPRLAERAERGEQILHSPLDMLRIAERGVAGHDVAFRVRIERTTYHIVQIIEITHRLIAALGSTCNAPLGAFVALSCSTCERYPAISSCSAR